MNTINPLKELISAIEEKSKELGLTGGDQFLLRRSIDLFLEKGIPQEWESLIKLLKKSNSDTGKIFLEQLLKLCPSTVAEQLSYPSQPLATIEEVNDLFEPSLKTPVSKLKIDPNAAKFFGINPSVLISMETHGYLEEYPIVVWETENGELIVVDGHSRVDAAMKCNIKELTIVKNKFNTYEEFLDAVIDYQFARRNVTIQDLFHLVSAVTDTEAQLAKMRQGHKTSALESADVGCANERIAAKLRISKSKVEQLKCLLKYGNQTLLGKVFSEEISLTAACKQIKKAKTIAVENDPSIESAISNKSLPDNKSDSMRISSSLLTELVTSYPKSTSDLISLTKKTDPDLTTFIKGCRNE